MSEPVLTETELREIAATWTESGEPSYMDAVMAALKVKGEPYTMPDLISGEWLLTSELGESDRCQFSTAYAARITGWYSFGCQAVVTHRVMARIVADQVAQNRESETDVLEWDGENVIHTAPQLDPEFRYVIRPDSEGLYAVPSWTWCRVDASDTVANVVR